MKNKQKSGTIATKVIAAILSSVMMFSVVTGATVMASSSVGIVAEAYTTFAANSVAETTDELNLRKGAGSSYDVITTLSKGTKLTVLKKNSNEWVSVQTANGKTGYVSADYLKLATESLVKYTTTDDLNYRADPSTSGTLKGTLEKGETVTVVDGYNKTANGILWYKLKIGSAYYYASSEYLKKAATSATTLDKVTGFKATTNASAVKLTWNKVEDADGYLVYRGKSGGGWEKIKTTTSLTYTDSGLTAGTEYKYAVKAYRKVNGTTYYGAYPTLTTATSPTKLTGLTVSAKTADTMTIKWNKVSGATGYYVYYRVYGSSKWIKLGPTTSLSYTFKNLTPNTEYELTARAYKTAGGVEHYGAYPVITGTTSMGLSKVTGFKATISTNAITLTWDAVENADGYIVYRGKSDGGWEKLKTTSDLTYTDSGLTAGTEYKYAVKAYMKVDGVTYYGAYPTLETATKTAKLTGLTVSAQTADTLTVQWNKVNGATGYYVYYRVYGSSKWNKLGPTTSLSYTFKNLSPNTKYELATRAYKTIGGVDYYSAYPVITGTTTMGLGKVTGFEATTSTSAVTLTWNAVENADGYIVYRGKSGGGWEKIKTTSSLTYTDSGLTAGTEYKYAVKAYMKIDGATYYGAYPTLTTATKPAKLTGLTVSAKTADTLTIKWNKVSGATGYYVYYRVYGSSKWIKLGPTTSLSYTFKNLSANTKYELTARAYKTADGVDYYGAYPVITGTTSDSETLVTYITTEDVNYRAAPGLSGEKKGVLSSGTTVQVVNGYSQTVDGIVWYKFKMDGKYYYISSGYLRKVDDASNPGDEEKLVKYITTTGVNYRAAPTVSGTLKGTLQANTVIEVVDGYSKTADNVVWYKFKLNGDYYYIASQYLKVYEGGNTSVGNADAYVPQLKTLYLTGYSGGKWASSNTSIATVNGGFVYGIKEGTVEISCTSGSNKKVWTVSVTAGEPVKLAYVGPNIASTGETVTFVAVTDTSRNAVKFVVNGKTKVVTDYTTETSAAQNGFAATTSRIWKYTTTFDKAGAYTAKIYSSTKADGSNMSSTYYTTDAYVVSTQDTTTSSLDTRRMSDKGLQVIASWEGYAPTVYLDPLTSTVVPTIGYGHTFSAGDTFYNNLTDTEAWALLCDVINKESYTKQVNLFIEKNQIKANQVEFDAMVSFSYNCGSGWWNGTSEFDLRHFLLNSVNPVSVQKKITAGDTVKGKTVLKTQVYSSKKQTGTGASVLASGTTVTIKEATWDSTNKAAWYKITAGSVTGYVPASYITITTHSFERDMNYMDAVTFGSEMLCWHHAGGNCYAGLVYRRLGESKLFSFGKYDAAMNNSSEKNKNTYGYLIPSCISTKNWLV